MYIDRDIFLVLLVLFDVGLDICKVIGVLCWDVLVCSCAGVLFVILCVLACGVMFACDVCFVFGMVRVVLVRLWC